MRSPFFLSSERDMRGNAEMKTLHLCVINRLAAMGTLRDQKPDVGSHGGRRYGSDA